MTIVNPLVSSHLVVQSTVPTGRPEERQNQLRPDQVVRATVVEGGLDRALLDLNHQRFRIQTDQLLLTGQQLELKVLTTHPQLTFKLLAVPIESRLAALFPLLAKSFDWNSLLLQIQSGPTPQPEAMKQVLKHLSGLLADKTALPLKDLSAMVSTLKQLKNAQPLFTAGNGPPLLDAIEQLLSSMGQRGESRDLPQQLTAVARQIRQDPELMREVMAGGQGKLAKLLTKIDEPVQPLRLEQAQQLATELKNLLANNPSQLGQLLGRSAGELAQLLAPATTAAVEVTPALLGQIKNLVNELQAAVAARPDWPPVLQQQVAQILGVMAPLAADPEILTQVGQLGLLSQLFGLNLEAELLRGKTRSALSSLKLALLGERTESGSKGAEALHRLELFQVCRVKLAEQNISFVPLPLPFLEEGFLLVADDGQPEQKADPLKRTTRMSLHLRLSALGNLRIDMLAEPAGMLLRIACEDQSRADFLREMSDQLQAQLKAVSISSLNFTTGVESPARELLKRILPSSQGMLDARV